MGNLELIHKMAEKIYIGLIRDFYKNYRSGNLWEIGSDDYEKPDHAKMRIAAFEAAKDYYK